MTSKEQVAISVSTIGVLVLLASLILLQIAPELHAGSAGVAWSAVVLVGAFSWIRAFRICLVMTPDHVEVRNLIRSRVLPWETVTGFSEAQVWQTLAGAFSTAEAIRVDSTSGSIRSRASVRLARRDRAAFDALERIAAEHGVQFDIGREWLAH